jgi:signal transduction histidine kinase
MSRSTSSLEQLGRRLLVAALAMIAVIALMVGVAFRIQATARSAVLDTLDPAQLAAEQLRSNLLDQETGIRGYALAANPALLEPYDEGAERAEERRRELVRRLGNEPALLDAVGAIDDAVERWRVEVAEPLVDGRTEATVGAVATRSRPLFDDVRLALDDLVEDVTSQREAARRDLVSATRLLWAAGAIALVMAVTGLAVVTRVLRRSVIAPLGDLSERSADVANGQFDLSLNVEGVREIEALSRSITRMRDRIRSDLRDVEEARAELSNRSDELARSNRDLEQFAYVASHDLQEPLRKVASFCELLEQRYSEQLDDRGRTYIHYAADGARRMQQLIADLLEFSRVGRTSDGFEVVDLTVVVESARNALDRALVECRGVVTTSRLPEIAGDRSLLVALFTNLLGNSLKYRGEHPPEVWIDAHTTATHVEVHIRDNGIGIAEEYRDKVFVIFQRLHNRQEYDGTGIGLSLCKKIVEFHGGTITIEEPDGGVGTAMVIRFPRHEMAEANAVLEQERSN